MTYMVSKNQFAFSGTREFPAEQSSFALHSKAMHVIINIFHKIFPCFQKNESVRVNLNNNKVVYVDAKSYLNWRNKPAITEWARKNHMDFDQQSIAQQIRSIISTLRLSNFDCALQKPLSSEIVHAIKEKNYENLQKIIQEATSDNLKVALLEQDTKKQANILAYAAHSNDLQAIDIITSAIDKDLLKEILIQKDKHEWTVLHHLALLNDNGIRYKELKRKAEVDAKTVSKFFCESPYMLRKYIRTNAGRFSSLSERKPMQIYFKNRDVQGSEEQHLSYTEFMTQHGHHFTQKPESFKSIPQIDAKFFQLLWENLPNHIERSESRFRELDRHIKAILAEGEEKGISLTPVKYNDLGEKIPDEINVGLGAQARKNFSKDQIVTLYGGEYFTEQYPKPKGYPRSDYAFGSDKSETVDGVRVRSYGTSFLHSAPNTGFEQFYSNLGLTFVSMTAVEDIQENEQLCLSYGSNYFKSRNIVPLELRPAARKRMEENPSKPWVQEAYLKIEARLK